MAEFLGERDFFDTYTPDEVKKMSGEEFRNRLDELVEAYNNEFVTFGIKRLRVKKK